MGSSQLRRDDSGRVNLSIIPQSHRSSSMADVGSISPSSLHNTTLYSTSSQPASPIQSVAPAEIFGQMLSEDTIPVPREKASQNLLRSTPPPIPDSLRLPAGLPEMDGFGVGIELSAENDEEITRPPRPSSEAPLQCSEPQVSDEEVIESPDAESGEVDSDWKPPANKKSNQNKRKTKSLAEMAKTTSTRKAGTSKVVKQHISQDPKPVASTSTRNTRRKGKTSVLYQPDGAPDEASQDTLPLNARVSNTASRAIKKDEPSHHSVAKLSKKEKPTKKGATRVPKKSFFDKQETTNDVPSERLVHLKEVQPEQTSEVNSKSTKTSRTSGTTTRPAPASDRPGADQESSRTVKEATRMDLTASSIIDKTKGSGTIPTSHVENDKIASGLTGTSYSKKTAPVSQPGSNQKKKRSPTYGSKRRRPWRTAAKGEPEIDSGLTVDTSRGNINTASKVQAKETQALGMNTKKESRSTRSRRSANLSIHSAGPSEIMSDPISDDLDASVSTSNMNSTEERERKSTGDSQQAKADFDKCLEISHKSPEHDKNEKLDMTIDLDGEPASDGIFSDHETESSPIEVPSVIIHPVPKSNPPEAVMKNNGKGYICPSEVLASHRANPATKITKSMPLVNELGLAHAIREHSAMKRSSGERRLPASDSTHLNRKRSIVSESGSPVKLRKQTSINGHVNFEVEENEASRTRQQTKPLHPRPVLGNPQAQDREHHNITLSTAAADPERVEMPREGDATLIDRLVRTLHAAPPRLNHHDSTTKSSAPSSEPARLFDARRVTTTNQQPTIHNYQSTIEFINKVAAVDEETHLEETNTSRESEVARKQPMLAQDIWYPRAPADREQEASAERTRRRTIREHNSLHVPRVQVPKSRHEPQEWSNWQDAVDDASESVVDTLHNVTVEMLRHLRSKESAVSGVVDEYRANGKRIVNSLVKKQDEERHNVAIAFHQQAMKFNQEFRGLASDDAINDKTPAGGRRISRYDDWQKEVHATRNRIRELRS